jgi:hypothetical protein
MQCLVLRHQLFFGLLVGGVRLAGFYRTNLSALGSVVSANAFSAFIGINLIGACAFTDCFVRALTLTSSTTDTFIGNLVRHKFLLDYF